MDLVAHIGQLSTRCAIIDQEGQVLAAESLRNEGFGGCADLIKAYLGRRRATDRPSRAAIAVPADVSGDRIQLSDPDWNLSKTHLEEDLGLRKLRIVNDLEALVWALPSLGRESKTQIGDGSPDPGSAYGLVCPGHQLRVGTLIPNSDGWTAIHDHGGNVSLAATDADEAAVIERIRKVYGQCTTQHVLSVPGLVNLYKALSVTVGRGSAKVSYSDVISLAQRREPLASKALGMFFAFLATLCSDLALTIGTRGGIYIGGEIAPKVLALMKQSKFRDRFEATRGVAERLKEMPTYVITMTQSQVQLQGLKRVLGHA